MNQYTKNELKEALQVVTSSISRCEKAHPKFAEDTSQYTLLNNRIKALKISEALILGENVMMKYTKEELMEALRPVSSIISKCEKAQQKHAEGTSYRTRFHNMIKAMQLSKSLITNEIDRENRICVEAFQIQDVPAILYGEASKKLYLYIHGKSGYKEEAESFAAIACRNGYQVLSFDLPEHGERKNEIDTFNPWHAVPELKSILSYAKDRWTHISVRANSIGAYFSMLSFAEEYIDQCLFVSPILDMEKLICNMMKWSGVSEELLKNKGVIPTNFGETLSWDYLSYVQNHRISKWTVPTSILYGTADNLTEKETVDSFVDRFGCKLTIMEGGEHWFHTPEQLEVLDQWTKDSICN